MHLTTAGYIVLLCSKLYWSKPVYNDQVSNQTVVWGVLVWFILPIIELPQSRLFNSGLNWVVETVEAHVVVWCGLSYLL